MTLVDDPPATARSTAPAASGASSRPGGWRLAARLARRETRRRPGRTVLVALLIAAPVAAMTVGSVLVRTDDVADGWEHQFRTRYGTADIARDVNVATAADPPATSVVLPPGTRQLEYLWLDTYVTPTAALGTGRYVTFTDAPLTDPMVASAIEIVEGEAPEIGEVALAPEIAEAWNLSVGDELRLERPSGSWMVSAIVRYRPTHWSELVVVPGFDHGRVVSDGRRHVDVWDLPDGVTAQQGVELAGRLGGSTALTDPFAGHRQITPILAWGWVAGVLALMAVGIIVAAAFATSARRQLVTVGHLAANGAEHRTVARMLALQGTWTALIGAAVGVAVGLVSLPFTRGLVEGIDRQDWPAYRVVPGDLVVIVVTAIIAGTIAAAVPARSAARVPVMAALAGRRPQPAPPAWMVPVGIALAFGGLGFVMVAATGASQDQTGSSIWPLLLILGVVGVVFGMISITPLVVERVGRMGRRAPLSWRLGLRSLSRSRTRSSAVIAAIAVAVGGSVAASAIVEQNLRQDEIWDVVTLPNDAVVVMLVDEVPCCEGRVDADALQSVELPTGLARRVADLLPEASSAPLVVATYDVAPISWSTYRGPHPDRSGPIVATPAMLPLLGLSDGDLRTLERTGAVFVPTSGWTAYADGTDAVSAPSATFEYPAADGTIRLAAPVGVRPAEFGYGRDRPIVTPAHAEQLGFELVERGLILRADAPLTDEQRSGLRDVFEGGLPGFDWFVEPGDPVRDADGLHLPQEPYWTFAYDDPAWRTTNDLWLARAVSIVAALLISAIVVAIGLSLAAAEGRDERDVLMAVGARPASMRRQAAARAAVLAGVGIALGVPTGYVPTWVLYRTAARGEVTLHQLPFPTLVVVAIAVAIPAGVAAIAWVGSGLAQRLRPPRVARRD